MAPIPMDQVSTLVTLAQRKIKKQKKTKNNLPRPVLIAIVVIVVVVLLAAILLPIIQKRRKARAKAKRSTVPIYSQEHTEYGPYGPGGTPADFGGQVTGGGRQPQQFHGAAEQEKYPMGGSAGHHGADFGAYGSGGGGGGGMNSDGRATAAYYCENQYSPHGVQPPPAIYRSSTPPPQVPRYQ